VVGSLVWLANKRNLTKTAHNTHSYALAFAEMHTHALVVVCLYLSIGSAEGPALGGLAIGHPPDSRQRHHSTAAFVNIDKLSRQISFISLSLQLRNYNSSSS